MLTRMDRQEVMRVFRAFESSSLEYMLIGAAARAFHGLVRATQVLRHCAHWWAIAPKNFPRGVFKFRTLEDDQKAHEKYLPLKE